ncbi:MAG: SusC/RagA family TonB-linked outer membrane protein, partial [Bacteroidetes bacterium]|nr:SusC/RagA family TonB-linked outer membrane protein [Bacteroidota bacterium]
MGRNLLFKFVMFLSALSFVSATAFAQVGNVTGIVTDSIDGTTLPGATVAIKGTTVGTVTDLNGGYSIKVNPNTTLVFSFVGFESKEILVQPNTTVNVAMKLESTVLSELVVIGYGVQKKGDATGSVSAIDAKEFNVGSITNPSQLIMGKVSGVQITNGGGAPGEGATIRIRGGSSLSASNDPLFVIDGVPVDNDGISGSRNPLNSVNPNDIETFTVLKDASATAIYGSRASNGVIIITTKKGKAGIGKGKPFTINYNGIFSLNTVNKTVDVLSGDEYRALMNERFPGDSARLGLLGTENTDWQSEIYRNSFGMDHNLSVYGVVKKIPYRVSGGYTDQDGILKTDNMKRTTISLSVNPSLLDDHLTVNVNAKANFEKNKFAERGAIGAAVQFDPTQPVLDPESPYGGYWAWLQDNGIPKGIAPANPVALLELRDDISDVNRIIGNVQLDYKFHLIPDLHANFNVGLDQSSSEGTVTVPENASWEIDIANGSGYRSEYTQEKKNELLDFYLNYVKPLDIIHSKVDVMAGYSWQHFYRDNYTFSG